MHSLRSNVRIAVLGLFTLPCRLLFGQAQAIVPAQMAQTDQQFAAIHLSLGQTADSILESASARTSELANQTITGSGTAPLLPKINTEDQSGRTNRRLDSLQARVRPIFRKQGIPDDLAAVIGVESGGNPLALSPRGARGLWQLMPETARRYGLTVDARRDDRVDLEKSTQTAARYLNDLHLQFGDWALALAAYNTGEQNVERAIARAGSREFQTLSLLGYLPAETRKYVPAVLAAIGSGKQSAFPSLPVQSTRLVYALAVQ
jgi:hypothetical protein